MKETVTYLIKHKTLPIYVTNKPSDNNPEISYSTQFSRAREFNGMEEASINMDYHIAIKKTVTETIEYEEVDNEF
ncbi:DUF2483 family protein [Staphylococcus saprophyticus]|nr:DUF2483 family protein [Staphylococcus saprophyticus]